MIEITDLHRSHCCPITSCRNDSSNSCLVVLDKLIKQAAAGLGKAQQVLNCNREENFKYFKRKFIDFLFFKQNLRQAGAKLGQAQPKLEL